MTDLDTAFRETEESLNQGIEAYDAFKNRQEDDDRSLIAKLIVRSFLGMVGIVILASILGTYLLGWEKLVEPGKFLMAILGSVMLPVVTLVIGYYFSTK